MDNHKLLIGGAIIIALVLAIPIIGPKIFDTSGYDPAADSHKIDMINKALKNYVTINQQLPPTLHYLVPDYLEAVPLTSTNAQFEYDPRTGAIINPSAPSAQPDGEQAGRSGGGGVPPVTDALTGLSVSEELNF